MNALFSPGLIQNLDEFRELFFSGKKEVEQIQKCPVPKNPGFYIQTKWQWVVEVIALPFKLISEPILYAIAYSGRFLKLYWLSTRCFILGYRFFSSDPISDYVQYGNRLLVSSFNNHQLLDSDVYHRAPLKIEDIPHSTIYQSINQLKIRQKTEQAINFHEKLRFNRTRNGGLCGGGCLWFIFLFLKAFAGKPSIPLWQRAYCVAKQFEYGQPKQAALLQIYSGAHQHLLPLKWEKLPKVDLENLHLDELPEGTHYLIAGDHALVFMKEKEEQCIWDSNEGLINILHINELKELINRYTKKPTFKLVCSELLFC